MRILNNEWYIHDTYQKLWKEFFEDNIQNISSTHGNAWDASLLMHGNSNMKSQSM